ncbi:MAG: hypothetical protein IJ604_04030 [Prevotella sp.]|nr:hypothetical protein [Prevotella sp.]
MNIIRHYIRKVLLACMMLTAAAQAMASMTCPPDSLNAKDILLVNDSLDLYNDIITMDSAAEDSVTIGELLKKGKARKTKRDWNTWRPEPKRALWMAAVIPGGGQIYNRKYWKLPIIYGGFIGCYYAMRWNGMMYKDYSQAYLDLMDDNPETQSYNQFMHLGRVIDDSNRSTYENKFKKRKDYYRRYRDMSAFIMIGVYALSIIDAYVDASLSEFDISEDLSMRVAPAVIKNGSNTSNLFKSAAVGLHCSLNF